jgi:hypothetical protein
MPGGDSGVAFMGQTIGFTIQLQNGRMRIGGGSNYLVPKDKPPAFLGRCFGHPAGVFMIILLSKN